MVINKYLIFGSTITGAITLILGLLLFLVFPFKAELSDGFQTPIIAFEFAKSEKDLAFLNGTHTTQETNRNKMTQGLTLDMFFPFAYGGFIALLLLGTTSIGKRTAYLGATIAVLIIPFDIYENIVLLEIISALKDNQPISELLLTLNFSTWLKWGAISLSMILFAKNLIHQSNKISPFVAAIPAFSIFLCWALGDHPILAELMTLLVSIFFCYFFVLSIIQVKSYRTRQFQGIIHPS